VALLFGAIYRLFGILGAICLELKVICCRWLVAPCSPAGECDDDTCRSSSLLAVTQILGLFLLLVLSIMVSLEMGLGMPIADFCAAGSTVGGDIMRAP
jgi:hypothetical protein